MATTKNEHWKDVERTHPKPDWLGFVVFRLLPGSRLRDSQGRRMRRFLGASAETEAKSYDVQPGQDKNQVNMGLVVEAENEYGALDNAMAAGIGALASAHIDPETVLVDKAIIVPGLALPSGAYDNLMVARAFPVPIGEAREAFRTQVEETSELLSMVA